MTQLIAMPRLGMKMQEGTVVEWRLEAGEPVSTGQVVLVIESDKAEVEIEANDSGFLRHIYVQPGETVACGVVLAAITRTDDEPFDPSVHAAAAASEANASHPDPSEASHSPVGAGVPARTVSGVERRPVAPAARRRAGELDLDVDQIPGSGPGGRVTREDVEAFAASREARTRVAEGVSLEVYTEGDGEPVVLVPGFGSDASVFAHQLPALVPHYRVSAIHPRGVGLSDGPAVEVYDVGTLSEDMAALTKDAVHLIGISLGAAIVLEHALRHPDAVRSLTLITPFTRAGPRLLSLIDAWCRIAEEASPETLAISLLPWLFSPHFLEDDVRRKRATGAFARSAPAIPHATLVRTAAGLRAWSGSRSKELAAVRAPTLVIEAGQDLLTVEGREIATMIPSCRLVTVPDAGHAVTLESPGPVNDALLEHLAAHRGREESP
jgi:pyruvate dehydrogenase E2 component (dihydrolipoamide acetyltransferase)